jgi:hypothetical protein
MKAIVISAAISTAITVLGLIVNYKLAVEPSQVERQALTELILNGDRAEAAVILTGRENARFQVVAQELGK